MKIATLSSFASVLFRIKCMIVNLLGFWLSGKMVKWLSSFPYIHLIFSVVKSHLAAQKNEENAGNPQKQEKKSPKREI